MQKVVSGQWLVLSSLPLLATICIRFAYELRMQFEIEIDYTLTTICACRRTN